MPTKDEVAVRNQDSTALMRRAQSGATVTPLADIYETADAYVLMLDMPGSQKDSISITIDKSSLVIKGEVESYVKENSKLLFNEIPNAAYQRTFNLTDGIDTSNVDAHYDNGVLTVKLFKKEEVKPREIRIQ
jgi:HSP20 family protein